MSILTQQAKGIQALTVRARRLAGACIIAVLSFIGSAQAQCPSQWLPGDGVPGVLGSVLASTSWDPDGAGPQPEVLIVGGSLSFAGDVAVNNIAAWNGTSWQPLGEGLNNMVFSLCVYEGDLIAGGYFTFAGEGVGVARWDGSQWHSMAGVGGNVYALTVHNGALFVGGSFEGRVARWTGASWQTVRGMSGSTSGGVLSLASYGGDLIVGGEFTTAGGVTANRIARWDGAVWHALGSGMLGPGLPQVRSLAVYDGQVVACGYFSSAGGVAAQCVARWNGAAWSAMGSGLGNQTATSLIVYNNHLIAGGHFDTTVGAATNYIAQWDGSAWLPLGGGLGPSPSSGRYVSALALYNGELIAGGYFSEAGDVGVDHVARWNGSAWNSIGRGTNGLILAFTTHDGHVVAGGDFRQIGGANASFIAEWDGAAWSALGGGMNRGVSALTIHDGDLIAGGDFTTAGGVSANRVARWDGAQWHAIGGGMNGPVTTLTVFKGELIAGGSFTTADSLPANRIARWNGSAWQPLGTGLADGTCCQFGPHGVCGAVACGRASALAAYDGDLVVTGKFDGAGGVPAGNIARWDGAAWHAIGQGFWGSECCDEADISNGWSLAVHDNELIVSGDFLMADSVEVRGIARWDGAAWHAMGDNTFGFAQPLLVHNGELLAAGAFYPGSKPPIPGIAKWDGESWNMLAGGIEGVRALCVHNSQMLAGGYFLTAGQEVSACWARWGAVCPLGDVDADGDVDVDDLLAVILAWGPCPALPTTCPADLNASGAVDVNDLLIVVLNWG